MRLFSLSLFSLLLTILLRSRSVLVRSRSVGSRLSGTPEEQLSRVPSKLHVPLYQSNIRYPNPDDARHVLSATAKFSCSSLAQGLSLEDCNYMALIGMFGQGKNSLVDNGRIWIGSNGANTFTFINAVDAPLTLIVWYNAPTDHQAGFMNVRQPEISYSLPQRGSAVELSVANGVPGGWSVLYNRSTPLTDYGQISNTFGEFSTGIWATVDISRLVNMSGDAMTVRVYTGEPGMARDLQPVCVSDLMTCAYACKGVGVNSCGGTGTYDLINCDGPNAVRSTDSNGNSNGGCQGWSYGGHIEVVIT